MVMVLTAIKMTLSLPATGKLPEPTSFDVFII